MSLLLPYVAECYIDGKKMKNLEVVHFNDKTALVRLPNGDLVKRSYKKHGLEITYIDVTR